MGQWEYQPHSSSCWHSSVTWNMEKPFMTASLWTCHRRTCMFVEFCICFDPNLELSSHSSTTKMIQMLFAVSTFISIGLQFYVPFGIIWRWVSHSKSQCVSKYFKNELWGELLVRIALALFICELKFWYSFQYLINWKSRPITIYLPHRSPSNCLILFQGCSPSRSKIWECSFR